MTAKKLFGYLFAAIAIFSLNSCEKDNNEEQMPEVKNGVYVLNEGKMNSNNASLGYYDFETNRGMVDVFAFKNSRGLGDIGQDIIKYGSRLYIAVTGSSTIEVVNAKTGTSIKSISMVDDKGAATSPRSLTSTNGKVFIVLFSGSVARLDTASLSVDKMIKVGPNPEKSIIVGNKLYVANTGGLSTVKDSTVSVIQLPDFTETTKIKVNLNPGAGIGADSDGNVYIQSFGNYGSIPGKFQRIEAGTNTVTDINLPIRGFTISGDKIYAFDFAQDADYKMIPSSAKIIVYDLKSQKVVTPNLINPNLVGQTPYSIGVHPVTGDVFLGVTDYVNQGKAYCFTSSGTLKYSFNTGVSPSKFVFIANQ